MIFFADAGSPTTTILETKVVINSTISDSPKGARFMSCDIKDFFLKSFMTSPEYMRIHKKNLPPDIITHYSLQDKIHNDYVYIKINKGMYGLPQAAIIAYEQLCVHLEKADYLPIPGTSCMFRHSTRPTVFCLCVDDFGIKYFSKADALHLLNHLGKKYDYTTDWSGTHFCGLKYDWNYDKKYVDVSLPGYV